MSTDILYRKAFIKVNNNLVIPMYEGGSSNCTMYKNGREVKARDWSNDTYHSKGNIIINNDDLLKSIDNYRDNHLVNKDGYKDDDFGWYTALRIYGKTRTTFSDYKNYYKNGIKNSKTIEEYADLNVYFTLQLSSYFNYVEAGLEQKPSITIKSTEHLINVVNEYVEYYKGTKCPCYITVSGFMMDNMFSNQKMVKRCTRIKKPIPTEFYTVVTEMGTYFVRNTKYGYKHSCFSITKKFKTEKECNRFIENQKKRGLNLKMKHIKNE
jgi:hypothetical protein